VRVVRVRRPAPIPRGPARADHLPPEALLAEHEAELAAAQAEADITVTGRGLPLAPGAAGAIEVTVTSHAASAIRGEIQLISPYGTWSFLPGWDVGFAAGPGAEVTVSFPVRAPADARPGQRWWVLAKVMYCGRARYSAPVEIMVTDPAALPVTADSQQPTAVA
jgi:hypothetical protein